ncbi:barstar family protein [Noviherbaspirillum galbum]|uniref:Barstar family protein n=1 Tax=Noviherbaspirillum galbum TaxID=2709383 RepID=A0A6B3SSY5_9BURK|nr:barstar family protein [Noviherbaspirillum galbum]NEX60729.1 barstar family protein [Noviherbaspirillum galbum]
MPDAQRVQRVQLDGRRIADWPGFHRESRQAFGFPDFYGNNLSAWIDCLSSLRGDGEEEGMSRFLLGPDECLAIEVLHADVLERNAPHIAEALRDAVDDVNERFTESGEKPALNLVFR